jgi:hypothetical protein
MIHDPYEIELLFKDKKKFFEALSCGDFNIMEYYNKKLL